MPAGLRWAGFAALMLFFAAPLHAQVTACAIPGELPVPRLVGPDRDDPRRVLPTGGYLLALSWSPQFCAGSRSPDSFQCEGQRNRFGFVLHGFWPQGRGQDWPQFCRPAERLSPALLRSNLCAMPSVDLQQHEWAKHGSCVTRAPARYFDEARSLYGRVAYPDMARLGAGDDLSVASFTSAFIAANARSIPSLRASGVRVRLSHDGWLQEVLLCLDRQRRFAACRANQASGAAPEQRMRIRLRA